MKFTILTHFENTYTSCFYFQLPFAKVYKDYLQKNEKKFILYLKTLL
jgi:hypothetical protein